MSNALTWQHAAITREQRERLTGQRGRVIWLTGLSGAGKSTLAFALEQRLHAMGHASFVLDGDNVRHGLCSDLGFSPSDRTENLRRVAEVAKLFCESGLICIAAFISPTTVDREMVRRIVGSENFCEVYVDCALEVCEARDVKGLYQKARAGAIPLFTGISAPYEPPHEPDLRLLTHQMSIEECIERLLDAASSS